MSIGLVITVKNETRILRNNILYHHAIGVDRIFVYFDGTTDNGKSSISDLDFVVVQDSISPLNYKNQDFLRKFTTRADEHHTARQCLNTYHALQECKALEYDWLISIDADELITINVDEPLNLTTYFSNLNDFVEVVNFRTLEVFQQKEDFGNVFANASLFKTRKNFKYRGENVFRQFYNPNVRTFEKHYYWYGQTMGKAAIKVQTDLIPHNVHRYLKKNGTKPLTINQGFVLHYHAYDAQDFIKKFRNFSKHPNHFLSGSEVDALKLLLRDVVNNQSYSDDELKEYFNKNLRFSDKNLRPLLKNKKFFFFGRKQPALIRVTSVIKIFENIKPTK